MRSRRAALWVLTASTLLVGVWALLAPGAFYRDFPLGRAWVAVDGPFNEHLVRDVGGLYLALTVVTAYAAWRGEPAVVRLAAAATLVFAVPHLAYHATHLAPYGPLDAAANVLTLGAVVLISVWLAWSPAPRTGAQARTPPTMAHEAVTRRSSQPTGGVCSASHTGCSARWARPRTPCRRRSHAGCAAPTPSTIPRPG